MMIDLRTTKLRTADAQEVIVPNTLIMSQIVIKRLDEDQPKDGSDI